MSWKKLSLGPGSPHCSQTAGVPSAVLSKAHSNSSSNEEAQSSSPRKLKRRPGSTNCSGPIGVAPRNSVLGGVASCTLHSYSAGDRSTTCSPSALRYWLSARTSKVCWDASPLSSGRNGPAMYGLLSEDEHGVHGEPSTEHWKVAPGWSLSKTKGALNWLLGSSGPDVINVSGSPVVTQTNGSFPGAGVGSTFGISAASSARTQSQCRPESSRSRNQTGPQSSHVVGAAGGVPWPHEHSKDSTCSLLAKAKVTSGPELTGSGLWTMKVSGGVVSTSPRISHS